MAETIYKIVNRGAWMDAVRHGLFRGSEVDLKDGFIHFSTAGQVRETAAKHFSNKSDLLLVEVDATSLGDALKWEVSRGGALFPHLYAPLAIANVTGVHELPLDASGSHVFPEALGR
jgi:uncharacterized protein (DUF952 family)